MFCFETRLVPMVCYRPGSYSAGHVQTTVLIEMERSITLSLNCQDLDVDKSKHTSNWLNCHQEKLKKNWGRSRKSTETPSMSPPAFLTATQGGLFLLLVKWKQNNLYKMLRSRRFHGLFPASPQGLHLAQDLTMTNIPPRDSRIHEINSGSKKICCSEQSHFLTWKENQAAFIDKLQSV